MEKKFLSVFMLILLMVMSGCIEHRGNNYSDREDVSSEIPDARENIFEADDVSGIIAEDMFSDRDKEAGYDESNSVFIKLNGTSASCGSAAVEISESIVTITDEGTYVISGNLDNGMIVVNADKKDKLQIVLKDALINSETSAPIYVMQADKVFITLAEASVNTLSNGGEFTAIDENNIDAVIYSKEDLTLNGSGSLIVTSPAGHGIVSKDDLVLVGGSYEINAACKGLSGKDSVRIADADIDIISGKDAIHSENPDDLTLGFVYIESGIFNICAEGDGLSASANMQIDGGHFNIITGGGSANAGEKSLNTRTDFMGGPGEHMGRPVQPGEPADKDNSASLSEETKKDSTSIKAIKASGNIVINGGEFIIDSADDAVHADTDVMVNGGVFEISTGDDGFHADGALSITSGLINITESYEGLEGLSINITGADIKLVSRDDGLNAAGGNDSSGFDGPHEQDMFDADSDCFINISGGTLYVNAEGDGIDSNGNLYVSGGYTIVAGPTNGGDGPLDYAGSASISGGTLVAAGSVQMAQTITSTSNQGVLAVSTGNQAAGTLIRITDSDGYDILSIEPEKSFQCIVVSCPDMVRGESYMVTVGELSAELAAG